MRQEFEQRVFYTLSGEECTKGMSEEEIKQIIHVQTDKIIQYGIDLEKTRMKFIRLSFEYPVLQMEIPDEMPEKILLQDGDENEKIEKLINYLNTNYHGI
jgi:hypothetical protein